MNMNENIKVIEIPKWGLSMEEGTIIEWFLAEGESFEEGDLLVEIESSKIINELEAHYAGTLRKILAQVDEVLPVGAPIAISADASVSEAEITDFVAGLLAGSDVAGSSDENEGEAPVPQPSAEVADVPAPAQQGLSGSLPDQLQTGSDDSEVHVTLHGRRLALQLGINLNNVTGTGRNKRISRQDVLHAVVAAGGTVADEFLPPGASNRADTGGVAATSSRLKKSSSGSTLGDLDADLATDSPLGGMRRSIATRLVKSKQESPHFRVVMDVEIDPLLAARKLKNKEQSDVRVTVNDYLVKACAIALEQVPACNVQFDGKTIRQFQDAHISVAVALEEGLISPIVRNANKKTLVEIAQDVRALASRAGEGSLAADEYQGGSFTISNLGAYGVKHFDAIINPPQGAILAVGAGEQRVIVRDGKAVVATVMTLTLSSDHRIIDGVVAAHFLSAVKEQLENPATLES